MFSFFAEVNAGEHKVAEVLVFAPSAHMPAVAVVNKRVRANNTLLTLGVI